MMETENAVHADDVRDDKVRQHHIKADVPEFLVITSQVSVQTAVQVSQHLHRLKYDLKIESSTSQYNSHTSSYINGNIQEPPTISRA